MNIYEENRILNASPVDLVRILYNAAVRSVENAREHLRSGDIAARSREIGKAQAILVELTVSLDASKSPEFGERLLALYDYMQTRLTEANLRQEDRPLAEVGGLLGILQEAWSQVEVEETEAAFG